MLRRNLLLHSQLITPESIPSWAARLRGVLAAAAAATAAAAADKCFFFPPILSDHGKLMATCLAPTFILFFACLLPPRLHHPGQICRGRPAGAGSGGGETCHHCHARETTHKCISMLVLLANCLSVCPCHMWRQEAQSFSLQRFTVRTSTGCPEGLKIHSALREPGEVSSDLRDTRYALSVRTAPLRSSSINTVACMPTE